jgi:hypothetical protein
MREGWAMPQISASDAAAQQFEDISYPQGLGCCGRHNCFAAGGHGGFCRCFLD